MRRWPLALGASLAALVATWGPAFLLSNQPAAGPAPAQAAPPPVADARPEPVAFARAAGVDLVLVSDRVVAVAFHEASKRSAVAMRPTGVCTICRNRRKFTPPRPERSDVPYLVVDSRGRPNAATSAVDLVVPPREEILSPATGTVVAVRRYRLYGRYPDVRVSIAPEGRPEVRVVILHVRAVRVGRGDRVVAGETPIGAARRFRFSSHVDRYVGKRLPHVHLEVQRGHPARS